MGSRVKVEFRKNFDLKKAGKAVKRPTKVLKDIGTIRRDDFNDIFNRELTPNHKKVKPLSPRYAATKPPNKKIRELTGSLYESYRQKISGSTLKEELTVDHASYVQTTRPLLPEEFDQMPLKIRKKILEVIANAIIKNL